jgi:hypothetical protein
MAYRSIKRVIGETSLERKCRFLFGACLSILLFVTFWWVEHIAEDLVKGTAIRKGNYLVDMSLLRYHWELWEPNEGMRELAQEMYRDLQTEKYDYHILSLEDRQLTELPQDDAERKIVLELKERLHKRMKEEAQADEGGSGAGRCSSCGGGRDQRIPILHR